MATRTRSGCYSFADFLDLVSEDQKADLLNGVIYIASPEEIEHNDLVGWFVCVLGQYVESRRLGKVTVHRVAYRLSAHNAPEPDVAFVRTERFDILKRGYVDGPPDLAIEVISPESVDRDYEVKRAHYESAGVREYWIIDPNEKRAMFLVLSEPVGGSAAAFAEARLEGTIFRSRVVAGFSLDTRWLWQRPLPESLPIVQSLLAHTT
jgi:Uma2 family endonuclease